MRHFKTLTGQKKIVAVDMDDTILFLMKAIHADHNEKHPDHQVSYEEMIAFDHSMLHPEYDLDGFFNRPGTFYDLEIMDEHVVDELQKMSEKHDVLIVTSAYPETVLDKWRWVQKHLPFIPFKNFITASRKDLILADILIDDAKHNVEDWVKTQRPVIVPSHHWNQDIPFSPFVTMMDRWKGMSDKVDFLFECFDAKGELLNAKSE